MCTVEELSFSMCVSVAAFSCSGAHLRSAILTKMIGPHTIPQKQSVFKKNTKNGRQIMQQVASWLTYLQQHCLLPCSLLRSPPSLHCIAVDQVTAALGGWRHMIHLLYTMHTYSLLKLKFVSLVSMFAWPGSLKFSLPCHFHVTWSQCQLGSLLKKFLSTTWPIYNEVII